MKVVRVFWRTSAMVIATGLAALPGALLRLLGLSRRRVAARIGSRSCSFWGRAACFVLGIRRTVSGAPHGRPFIVAANHLSYIDILVLGSIYPSLFVAKKEVANWPLLGWVTRHAGTLFVDRERPKDVVRIGRLMERRLGQGFALTLFAEGGTSRGETVRPFLPSLLEPAARTGVPCFAASISYDTPGESAPPAETVCWSNGAPFPAHIRRLMGLPVIEARIRFSELPLRSSNRKELARRLREEVLVGFTPIRQNPLPQDSAEAENQSRGISQIAAPQKSQSRRPSSQSAASGEKTRSVK
jgi:1-acyl-sn-glycerol-3-phosphate acyltransferase